VPSKSAYGLKVQHTLRMYCIAPPAIFCHMRNAVGNRCSSSKLSKWTVLADLIWHLSLLSAWPRESNRTRRTSIPSTTYTSHTYTHHHIPRSTLLLLAARFSRPSVYNLLLPSPVSWALVYFPPPSTSLLFWNTGADSLEQTHTHTPLPHPVKSGPPTCVLRNLMRNGLTR
jgi:hypothetical protein